jgi:hypothetical protein
MSTWKKVLTAADITALGSGSIITNSERTKLTSVATDADVTNTASVTAAGALMDSELTDLAGVKAVTISTLQVKPSEGAFANGDKTKLDAIEASADVTDAANVTAAGALMDSELTDLAGVKGVTISTLQVKPSEGAFADGDKTKLNGIEASADVTDTANVTSAGALMDSEVTNLAQVKAFDSSDYATSAQGLSKSNLTTVLATYDGTDTLNIGDGDDDTTVVIRGNLQVDGTTTTVNSATLTIDDHIITAASGSTTAAAAGTAGLEIATGNATQLPFVGFVDGAGLTEMVVKAEGVATAFPIAIMEFGAVASTLPTGDAGGVGSFHYNTADSALYIRTA